MLLAETVLLLTAGMLVTIGGDIPRHTATLSSPPRIPENNFPLSEHSSRGSEDQKTPNFRCKEDRTSRTRDEKFRGSFRNVLNPPPLEPTQHRKIKNLSELPSTILLHSPYGKPNQSKPHIHVNTELTGSKRLGNVYYLTELLHSIKNLREGLLSHKAVHFSHRYKRIAKHLKRMNRSAEFSPNRNKTKFSAANSYGLWKSFRPENANKGRNARVLPLASQKLWHHKHLLLKKPRAAVNSSQNRSLVSSNPIINTLRDNSPVNSSPNAVRDKTLKRTGWNKLRFKNSLQMFGQLFSPRRNSSDYSTFVRKPSTAASMTFSTRKFNFKRRALHEIMPSGRNSNQNVVIKKCDRVCDSDFTRSAPISNELKGDGIKDLSPVFNLVQSGRNHSNLLRNARKILFLGPGEGMVLKRIKRESETGSSNGKTSVDSQTAGHQGAVLGEIPKVHKTWEIVSSQAASMEKKKNDSLRGLHDTSVLNALSNSTLVFGGEKEIWNRPRGPHSGEVSTEISADDEGKRLSVLPPDGALVDFPHRKAKEGANDDKNGAILHRGPALIIHEPERNDDEDDDDTVVTSSEGKDPAGGDSGVSADSSEFDPAGNRWISDGAHSVTEMKSSSRDESYNDTTAEKLDEKCSDDAKLCGEDSLDQQDAPALSRNMKDADKNDGTRHNLSAILKSIQMLNGTGIILKSILVLNGTSVSGDKSEFKGEVPNETYNAFANPNGGHLDTDVNSEEFSELQSTDLRDHDGIWNRNNSEKITQRGSYRVNEKAETAHTETLSNQTNVEHSATNTNDTNDFIKMREKSKLSTYLKGLVSSTDIQEKDSKLHSLNQAEWETNNTSSREKSYAEIAINRTSVKPNFSQFKISSDEILSSNVSLDKQNVLNRNTSDDSVEMKNPRDGASTTRVVKLTVNSSKDSFSRHLNSKITNHVHNFSHVFGKNSSSAQTFPRVLTVAGNNISQYHEEKGNYENHQMFFQQDSGFIENVASTTSGPSFSKEDVFREYYGKKEGIRHYTMLSQDGNLQSIKRLVKRNSTSSTDSPSTTTPDPHMNDPPFVRGPNISPEVELFSKKEKDESKKTLHPMDPIIEPPKFQTSSEMEWRWAKKEWGIAWDCHCYLSGVVFLIVAVYSFISLLRVKTFVRLLSLGYFVTINVLVLLGSAARALYLLHDPYNSSEVYPEAVSHTLFNIALPCLSSAFAVLFLALLQSTKTQLLPPNLQRPHYLAVLVVFHFSFAATCDIVSSVFVGSKVFLLISCHVVFLMWCLLTSISFFCVFRRAHRAALRKQGEMIRITFTKMHIDGADLPKKLPKPTLGLAVKVTFASAVLQVIFCFLFPYGVDTIELLYPHVKKLSPWLWWGYHLLCRILEQGLFVTISFTATQPLKHFEIGDNRFCNVLLWLPCSSFAEFCQKEEVVDFEAHSDNYANLQGFRNCGFTVPNTTRRLQTNSLPTFRTPIADIDNTLPMRNLPYSGRTRNTNHPSALSLLSYYRSKRNLSLSTNGGLGDLERTIGSHGTLSSLSACRPASMLYKDNGFIRFRTDNDPQQPMELSDEDDRAIHEDPDTSAEDADSTRAMAGSSIQSLLEDDIVQSTLSPFFRLGFSHRFRKMSRISIETTDNSVNVSSEQLSNIGRLSGSALDFSSRKHGSTCSSESAANSFDVTFYLHRGNSSSVVVPQLDTPSSAHTYRSEAEEDKTSSVEGHEVLLRSVSPIVKRSIARRLHEIPLNLNLSGAGESGLHCGHVNVACGTEDITPDSAVYLDLQLSKDPVPSSFQPSRDSIPFGLTIPPPPIFSFSDSLTPSSEDTSPSNGTPLAAVPKPNSVTATSQSLSDLRTSNSYVATCRSKRTSRGLLNKLRGSTFSLNATFNGYEPLEPKTNSCYYPNATYHHSKRKLRRVSSDRRSEEELQAETNPTPLAVFRDRCVGSSAAHLGDSGLLGDCPEWGVTQVDVASQTDPALEYNDTSSNTCDTYSVSSNRSPMSLASSGTVGAGK